MGSPRSELGCGQIGQVGDAAGSLLCQGERMAPSSTTLPITISVAPAIRRAPGSAAAASVVTSRRARGVVASASSATGSSGARPAASSAGAISGRRCRPM